MGVGIAVAGNVAGRRSSCSVCVCVCGRCSLFQSAELVTASFAALADENTASFFSLEHSPQGCALCPLTSRSRPLTPPLPKGLTRRDVPETLYNGMPWESPRPGWLEATLCTLEVLL